MTTIKQSTARTVLLKLFLTSDHLSAATGKTLTVTLSKDGAAFAAAGGSVTELSNGWYKFALTTTDTNTLGELAIRATAADSDAAERLMEVVSFDPQSATNLGLTNLDAASSTLATAAALTTVDDFLDTEIAAIKAKTDNLPASPAAVGSAMTLAADSVSAAALAADAVTEIQSGLATAAALTTVDDFLDTEIAAIKAKTDLIPASPAAVGDLALLATQASVDTIDNFLDTEIAAILAAVDTEVAAILTAVGLLPTAAAVSTAVWAAGTRSITDKAGFSLATAPPTATENADALLTRDWTSVSGEAARSALNALRAIRNKVSRSGSTLTVTEEDDATTAWTATLTTDAAAVPVTAVDPG